MASMRKLSYTKARTALLECGDIPPDLLHELELGTNAVRALCDRLAPHEP